MSQPRRHSGGRSRSDPHDRTAGDGAAAATLGAFMEARLARDEARVRSYLAPALNDRLDSGDLLPAGDPRWVSYTILRYVPDPAPDARVVAAVVRVVLSDPAWPRYRTFDQTVILVRQPDGRWLVNTLGPRQSSP